MRTSILDPSYLLLIGFGTLALIFGSPGEGESDRGAARGQNPVIVETTASPSYVRTHEWEITKTADRDTLRLRTGQTGTVRYTIDLSRIGTTDSQWGVAGDIVIRNPTPQSVTIMSVGDHISGFGDVEVHCPAPLPHQLPPQGTLTCQYGATLPDAEPRTNSAMVEVMDFGRTESVVDVDFSSVTPQEVDREVTVEDAFGTGGFGPVSEPYTRKYERSFLCPEEAGEHVNTAKILETGRSASAYVTVVCDGGR